MQEKGGLRLKYDSGIPCVPAVHFCLGPASRNEKKKKKEMLKNHLALSFKCEF